MVRFLHWAARELKGLLPLWQAVFPSEGSDEHSGEHSDERMRLPVALPVPRHESL
jgi:hypothetical protein